jgi:hypothetical protein
MFLVINNLNLSKKMENQNIAYNRYEKKMAKYRMNLKKRNNKTKASAWLKWGEIICIPEKEAKNQQNGMYEYVTTKRHGKVVSRYKYKFDWNTAAKEAKKYNHDVTVYNKILNKVAYLRKSKVYADWDRLSETERAIYDMTYKHADRRETEKRIQLSKYTAARLKKANTSRAERLEKIPFSQYHYKLVNELYSDNKQDRIMKQQALAVKHDKDISALIEKLKSQKDKYYYPLPKKEKFIGKVPVYQYKGKLYQMTQPMPEEVILVRDDEPKSVAA